MTRVARRNLTLGALLGVTCAIIMLVALSTIGLLTPSLAAIISTSTGVVGLLLALLPMVPASKTVETPAQADLHSMPGKRTISGLPPPVDARTIQQRTKAVTAIVALLTRADVNGVQLTGLGGVGKSTMAALVVHALEAQAQHRARFTAAPIWLTLDASVTMSDLIANLCVALDRPLPDMRNLSPQSLALALFEALKTTKRSCLVVLDQFDSLLDAQTGSALVDRSGVGEWLDALNSQPFSPGRCRVLLTSRVQPQGARVYPATYLRSYEIGGLEPVEGRELLQHLGVQATSTELDEAVQRCDGHPLALTLLAALLQRNRSLTLPLLLHDTRYTRFWSGDIARNMLDYIYSEQLNPLQRRLLLAFSVYREAVPFTAAQALLGNDPALSDTQVVTALETLLAQHLLQAPGAGNFQLHALVADYAFNHFDSQSETANLQARQLAHARAAQYYLQQIKARDTAVERRRQKIDTHELIEVVWHECQAGRWQEAYAVMKRENMFAELRRWGANDVLLELSTLLLPLDKWQAQATDAAYLYNHLGRLYDDLNRSSEALTSYQHVLKLSREQGDGKREGVTLNNIGRLVRAAGRLDEAQSYFEQALQVCRTAGDRGGEGTTLNNLGSLLIAQGHKQEARTTLEQALEIFRTDAKYPAGEARALNALGQLHAEAGEHEQAQRLYEQALHLYLNEGDRRGEARALHHLGTVATELGQYEQANDYLEQALALSISLANRHLQASILNDLARIHHERHEEQQALTRYREALHIAREERDMPIQADTLLGLATLYQSRPDYALACLLLARTALLNADPSRAQQRLDALHQQLGNDAFATLQTQVEPQAEKMLNMLFPV